MCSSVTLIKPKPRCMLVTPKYSESNLIRSPENINRDSSTNNIINENLGFVMSKKIIKACSFESTEEDDFPQFWSPQPRKSDIKMEINNMNTYSPTLQQPKIHLRKSAPLFDGPPSRCENPIINDEIFQSNSIGN